ncbi:MAG: response regulator [Pirellulaceae bacterium]
MIDTHENPRRILIVDDNPSIHDDFRRVLLQQDETAALAKLEEECFGESLTPQTVPAIDYRIEHAMQGEEALEKLKTALANDLPFDLAFVDMRMPPGWDGLQTIKELWSVDAELEIVICTAYSDHTWSEIVSQIGQNHHLLILKKPFDVVEIQQMALGLTEKRRMARMASLKMHQLTSLVVEETRDLREEKSNIEELLKDIIELVSPEDTESLQKMLAQ